MQPLANPQGGWAPQPHDAPMTATQLPHSKNLTYQWIPNAGNRNPQTRTVIYQDHYRVTAWMPNNTTEPLHLADSFWEKKPCSQLVTTVQKLSDLVIFRNTYTHHHCNLVLQRETSVESLLIVIMKNDNHLWGKITAWNHCLSVSIPCWNSKYQKGDITCQHNDYTAMCC